MRAISVFSLEAGTSTLGWRALIALRTRVSMSAIGSLVIPALQLFLWLSPARLRDAGDFPVQRQLAEAQPANAELAQKRARPAAAPAAVAVLRVMQARRLGGARLFQFQIFGSLGGGGHVSLLSPLLPERHAELLQQRHTFRVGARRSGDGDIHPLGLLHFGVIDFRKNQLLANAQR